MNKLGKEKSLLYLYGYSAWDNGKLGNLSDIISFQIDMASEIVIVLIHDAVLGASKKAQTSPELKNLLKLKVNVYAMEPDLIARGFKPSELLNGITALSYDGLVELMVKIPKIVSIM